MPDPNQNQSSALPQLDMSTSQPLPGGSAPQGSLPKLDMSTSQPLDANGNPVHNDELKITKPWYTPTGLAQRAGSAVEGVGEGVFSTLAGAGDLVNKAHDAITGPDLESTMTGHNRQLIPTQELHKLAGDENTPGSSNNYNKTGYGGETLMEFMMGDEALKGMSTADKALNAGKTLKVVEKSPKLMQALKIGAKELAKQSARAGIVQGAQTYVRSGGNAGAALESGLEGAATTGVLGGVLGSVGGVASKLGEAGKTAGELAETAANAPDKQTIAENIQGQLQNAKTALHNNYEAGINDLTKRLGDNSVEVKGSPISTKAQELLEKPDPEDHDLTKQAKELAGDKIDKDTRALLESYANGTKPLTEEDIKAAKEASKPSGLVDASGKPLPAQTVEPQAQPAAPLTATDLIQQRQAIRSAASKYQPGDINARVLNNLLGGFDDTMDQIASKSGDADAVKDYQNLRADYRGKIGVYNNNPVIKNLMAGKLDDAAKAFVATKNASGLPTTGKTLFNADQLHTVLGDAGFTKFRDSVFDGLMKVGSDDNGFNPAKFMATWSKIADGTKSDLFGYGDPAVLPQNYITSVIQDAKTATNAQRLVRAGVLGTGGTLAAGASAVLPPTVTGGLSTVLAYIAGHEGVSGGGIAKGRDLIDYVANHPKSWAALRGLGKAAESNAAQTATKVIPKVGQAAVALGNANQSTNNKAAVYNTANTALGGTQDQVVVPADASRGVGQVTLPVTTPQQ